MSYGSKIHRLSGECSGIMPGHFSFLRTIFHEHIFNLFRFHGFTKTIRSAIMVSKGERNMRKISQKYVGLRLPEELYQKVYEIAKAEDRSVGYIIRRMVREALEGK